MIRTIAVVIALFVAVGCTRGNYRYRYTGRVFLADGVTPAAGVAMYPFPASRGKTAKLSPSDANIVISDGDGHFSGTMRGWINASLIRILPPQATKADKVWVYLPNDSTARIWKPVVVPTKLKKDASTFSGTMSELRVVLPGWYVR